jgi:predicted O-methyltransferase YrrM
VDHFYKSIPGWAAFQPLYQQMVELGKDGQRFVEVGSWLGRSAAYMAVEIINSGKRIEFTCVDPWEDGGPDLRDTEHYKNLGVRQVYDLFRMNIEPVIANVKMMRMDSVTAASYFEDGSVDFLMLDGDHSYQAVSRDIHAWLPKMAVRGVISGDDYTWPGVERAVQERLGKHPINTVINGGQRRKANYKLDSSFWWVQL